MTSPHLLDLRKLPTPKIEALRDTFESHLRSTLFQGLPEATARQLLVRSKDGYAEAHIDAAWNGFQWGGEHVRSLVQAALQHLGPSEVRKPGDAPADPTRPNAEVVAASHYPGKKDDPVDWSLPLFDSDGYAHRLVELGGVQVVTKVSFAYAVWDRKTLELRDNPGPGQLTIGNTAMAEEERERRRQVGAELLAGLHASASAAQAIEDDPVDEGAPAPRG